MNWKPTVVGSTDFAVAEPDQAPTLPAEVPSVNSRRRSDDPIFFEIDRHRRAAEAYERAVDTQNAAEGKVSAEEFAHLQHCARAAFQDMMLFAQCLVIVNAKSRAGLIALAKYLEQQFNDREGCENGCLYMPDDINGKLWPQVFMRSLARKLRRMGADFRPAKPTKKSIAEHDALYPEHRQIAREEVERWLAEQSADEPA